MSYAHVVDHQSMVFDDTRNALYREALRSTVPPGARVMDLGAGLGILGLIALQEGASEVVMVEPAPVLRAARALARDLGVADRIRFLEKRVEEIDEALEVDAILSVFTGNFLLEEDLLPSLFHARDRFLVRGGALLPRGARMRAMPVDARPLYESKVEQWSTPASGVDLSSLRRFAANSLIEVPRQDGEPRGLSPPVTLEDIDFLTATEASCDATVTFEIATSGVCHGLCGWFEARLGDSGLSTGPDAPGTHWSPLFLPIGDPVAVEPGETLEAAVHRPMHGDWTWTLTIRGRRQRQSTFLAMPTSTADLVRMSRDFRPRLGEAGEAMRYLLARMDGSRSLDALARELHERFPRQYPDPELAFRTIQAVSTQFAAPEQD